MSPRNGSRRALLWGPRRRFYAAVAECGHPSRAHGGGPRGTSHAGESALAKTPGRYKRVPASRHLLLLLLQLPQLPQSRRRCNRGATRRVTRRRRGEDNRKRRPTLPGKLHNRRPPGRDQLSGASRCADARVRRCIGAPIPLRIERTHRERSSIWSANSCFIKDSELNAASHHGNLVSAQERRPTI